MKEKILILGASGFIGGYLVEEALSRGLDTYAAIRKTSDTQYLKDDRIKLVYPNLQSLSDLSTFFQQYKFDYIIHNIGLTKGKDQDTYDQVNVSLLKNVIEALGHPDYLKKFIFISSLAAYGPAEKTKSGIVFEKESPHPVTFYGKSKLKAESFLKKQAHIPYHMIRPTAVYGPREKDFLSLYKTINSGLSITIGKTKQKLSFIYVEDLVSAIYEILYRATVHKNYFIAHPRHHSGEELNAIVKEILKKKTLSIRLSPSFLRIIGRISEIFSTFTRNYPALNQEKVNELECQSWICDTESLKEDLGFVAQIDLEEGMKKTIHWNLEQSLL